MLADFEAVHVQDSTLRNTTEDSRDAKELSIDFDSCTGELLKFKLCPNEGALVNTLDF